MIKSGKEGEKLIKIFRKNFCSQCEIEECNKEPSTIGRCLADLVFQDPQLKKGFLEVLDERL